VTWGNSNFIAEASENNQPSSVGSTVTLPYPYTVADCSVIPEEVGTHAGATLFLETAHLPPLALYPSRYSLHQPPYYYYNLSGQRVNSSPRGILIVNNKLVFYARQTHTSAERLSEVSTPQDYMIP
jgi:hypothetical protein